LIAVVKMSDIERVVREALLRSGAQGVDRLTRLVADNIRKEYGGSRLYIGGVQQAAIESRNQSIRASIARGIKQRQAAERFGVSVKTVQRACCKNK